MTESLKYDSLGKAVKYNDAEELNKMLNSDRARFNSEKEKKNTLNLLLSHAAGLEEPDCLGVLLKHGADPDFIDPNTEMSILEQAVNFNSVKNLEVLCQNGVDINAINSDGNNIITTWLRQQPDLELREDGHFVYDIVKKALESGLDVNSENIYGRSMSHEAVLMLSLMDSYDMLTEQSIQDITDMIDHIIVYGADLEKQDLYGKTASEYISENSLCDPLFEHMEDVRLGKKQVTKADIDEKENDLSEKNITKMRM